MGKIRVENVDLGDAVYVALVQQFLLELEKFRQVGIIGRRDNSSCLVLNGLKKAHGSGFLRQKIK